MSAVRDTRDHVPSAFFIFRAVELYSFLYRNIISYYHIWKRFKLRIGLMDSKIDKPESDGVRRGLKASLSLFFASVLTGTMSLYFAARNFGGDLFLSYFINFKVAALNILPVIIIMAAFYFLFKRLWIAYIVTALLVMPLSWINYFKLLLRDDPLYAEDLLLAAEAGDMAVRYDVVLDAGIVCSLMIMVAAAVLIKIFADAELKKIAVRAVGFISSVVLFAVFMVQCILNTSFYDSVTNLKYINEWSPSQVFASKGFIYPFLYSMASAVPEKPEGYSAHNAEQILSGYDDCNIPDDRKVNIICVMLEAFNDFSRFDGIKWEADPYEIYHEIEAESVSGNLITNIFAGGTVNTERCFLTGYADAGSLRKPTASYVRYLSSQGYTVEGAHPSYGWFYNRKNINENLGFDRYWFFENRYDDITGGSIALDNIFFDDLYNLYKEGTRQSDKPYFSFNVTYQNHGPYEKYLTSQSKYYLSAVYGDEEEYMADNYFSGIYNTFCEAANFLTRLKEDDEPVVVMMFGDHNPYLGSGNSVYHELGINIDQDDDEGFKNYYGTRYFIWANDKAKEALDNDFIGEGPDTGPYFLMNVLFNECGFGGNAYMGFTDDVMSAVPVIHSTGVYMQDGEITETLKNKNAAMVDNFEIVQYYMKYDAKTS